MWHQQAKLFSLLRFCLVGGSYKTAGRSWERATKQECWECPQTKVRNKETEKKGQQGCVRGLLWGDKAIGFLRNHPPGAGHRGQGLNMSAS